MADPDLGQKPLLAKLREQQPDLGAGAKEVREALTALTAESKAKAAASAAAAAAAAVTAALPAADEGGAPAPAALSLACIGCFRLPSDMDDGREKHPICDMCRDEKLPTTYLCGKNCPANPDAWLLHGVFHKRVRRHRKGRADGGVAQQRDLEAAKLQARYAAQTGDEYDRLLAEGARYTSMEDRRRAAKAYREAIALRPDEPWAYFSLGHALNHSGHDVEAAQRYLEAMDRMSVGSGEWAEALAEAFDVLIQNSCDEVAKPEWWNDQELKALSARVVRVAPNDSVVANSMRARVLHGECGAWGNDSRLRSSNELIEAATHYERTAALCPAPAMKVQLTYFADQCRAAVAGRPLPRPPWLRQGDTWSPRYA